MVLWPDLRPLSYVNNVLNMKIKNSHVKTLICFIIVASDLLAKYPNLK